MNRFQIRMMQLLRLDEHGSIAVEFALVAPILMIVLAGVIDIGSAAYTKISLQSRVTTAGEYALMQSAPQKQDDFDDLAEEVIELLEWSALETANVIVNNAVSAEWDGSSPTEPSGTGDVEAYYCIGSAGEIDWASVVDRDTICSSDEPAGQFVQISASARHVSLFPGYAFSDGDTVSARAVLRLN